MRNININARASGSVQSSVTVYRKVTITIEGTPNGKTYIARSYPISSKYYIVPIYTLTVSGKDDTGKDKSETWDVLRFMPFYNPGKKNSHYPRADNVFFSGLTNARKKYLTVYNPKYKVGNTPTPEDGSFRIEGGFLIHDGPDDINKDFLWGAAGCIEVCGASGFNKLKQYISTLSGYKGTDIENHLINIAKSNKIYLNLKQANLPALTEYTP